MTAISLREIGLGDEATIEAFAEAFARVTDEISALHPPYCTWPSPQHTPEAKALGNQLKAEIDGKRGAETVQAR